MSLSALIVVELILARRIYGAPLIGSQPTNNGYGRLGEILLARSVMTVTTTTEATHGTGVLTCYPTPRMDD